MCGIVGFISNAENAIHNAMNGLKTLEYRGYDSAGAAFLYNGKFQNVRAAGDVSKLFTKIDTTIKSRLAIAHTRWATHGLPNETNAHPHKVGDVVIVHNGIIENYKELSIGLKLKSQTDSEVIAHLIYKANGTLLEKVQSVVKRLKGSYALAVVSEKEPDRIVLASRHSPIVIGMCQKGAAIASDVYALIGHATNAVALRDDETALITDGKIQIFDIDNNDITNTKTPLGIIQDLHNIDHDHNTFMHKEIFEQPRLLLQVIANNESSMHTFKSIDWNDISEIIFTGCGTSYHACLIAQLLFEEFGLECNVRLASELRYSNKRINENCLFVAVSQSGETADTLAAMRIAKEKGAKTIAIVNRVGSTMERESDITLYTYAGPEMSVAATKSFTTQMMLLYLIGLYIKKDIKTMEELKLVPVLLDQILNINSEQQIVKVANEIAHVPSMFFLGRGYGVPVAMEGALKLKEISYIHAEAYPAGEMKHGSIALITKGVPCVVVADDNSGVYEKMISNIQEVKTRGALIVAVANNNDKHISDIADYVIRIPQTNKILMPFMASVVLQLLAYHIADIKGCNIDRPRNLAKSCTVE